ncbi:MAG: hypothetical protein ACOYXT_03945 [Bacteroidota bacterium]
MGLITDHLAAAENKGPLLELLIEDILNDWKLKNVKRQKSGSQFGYDVVGFKENNDKLECWKFECKNLKGASRITDIAPKLLWHLKYQSIDRFIIVSPFGISNELFYLLEKKLFYFPVEIWQGDYLEKVILESPRALSRIGVDSVNIKADATPLVFLPSEIFFDAYHFHQRPFSYDYFFDSGKVIKAYTEHHCNIISTINNPTQDNLIVHQINILTTSFKRISGRIMRQFKFKGIVEPIKLQFTPATYAGGKTELLLDSKLLEVKANSTEHLSLILSDDAAPGYYEFLVEICGRFRSKPFEMYSQAFSIHKPEMDSDFVQLFVIGKHHDAPVEEILSLDESHWNFLKTKTGSIQPSEITTSDSSAPLGRWAIQFAESDESDTVFEIPLNTPLEEPYSIFGPLQSLIDKFNSDNNIDTQ